MKRFSQELVEEVKFCAVAARCLISETLGTTLSKTGIQPLLALVDLTILKIYVSGDLKFEVLKVSVKQAREQKTGWF